MSDYRIFETAEFLASFKRMERDKRIFLERKLREYVYPRLRQEPFYGPQIRKLKGYSPDTWRYRIGDYRLFYSVDSREKVVFILTLDDRKVAYR